MWDPPGPGLEPMSPALAGGFLTTAPPGMSPLHSLDTHFFYAFVLSSIKYVLCAVSIWKCPALQNPTEILSLLNLPAWVSWYRILFVPKFHHLTNSACNLSTSLPTRHTLFEGRDYLFIIFVYPVPVTLSHCLVHSRVNVCGINEWLNEWVS